MEIKQRVELLSPNESILESQLWKKTQKSVDEMNHLITCKLPFCKKCWEISVAPKED